MENGSVDEPLQPWAVSEAEYPTKGDTEERVRFLLGYAILARSGHNTQPWLFRIRDQAVEVLADRTRALPVVDPDDRALVISCGAALATLRIAARHFGFRADVDVLPDPRDEDLVARVSLEPGDSPSGDEETLFRAIRERHSNRQAFEVREVGNGPAGMLVAEARDEGVGLHLIRGDDRGADRGADRRRRPDPDGRQALPAGAGVLGPSEPESQP